MGLGLYGKHPVRGDFLETGVPADMLRGLESWLDTALGECRADLDVLWEQAWERAPVVRFWLGEDVLGQALCGVMTSSQDKVGRRFPLVLLWSDPNPALVPAPPVIDTDQHWYEGAEAHLRASLLRAGFDQTTALLEGLAPPQAVANAQPGPIDFWAATEGGEAAGLLADVAQTDHRRAVSGRSYWWVAADVPAIPVLPSVEDDVFAAPQEEEVSVDAATETTDETTIDAVSNVETSDSQEVGDTSETSDVSEAEADPEVATVACDTDTAPQEDTAENEEAEGNADDVTTPLDTDDAQEDSDGSLTSEADTVPESTPEGEPETEAGVDTYTEADMDIVSDPVETEDSPPLEEEDAWSLTDDSSPFASPFDTPAPDAPAFPVPSQTPPARTMAAAAENSWSDAAWLDPDLPEDVPDFTAPPPQADIPAPKAPINIPQPAAAPRLNGPISRFHGGAGLPSGVVLAWFLREA